MHSEALEKIPGAPPRGWEDYFAVALQCTAALRPASPKLPINLNGLEEAKLNNRLDKNDSTRTPLSNQVPGIFLYQLSNQVPGMAR